MISWPIVGHEWATRQLQAAVLRKETSHAILITGPESVGKFTLARLLSAALLCKADLAERPCGQCISCRKLDSGNHPDFMLADLEEGKQKFSVETIRDVERFLFLTPIESEHKVAVIINFEQASEGAANALLKTLEEPPSYGKLIVLATDADLLLPTIVSRSQQVNLRPVAPQKIAAALIDRWDVPPEKAAQLARISGGRAGWAIRAAIDPEVQKVMENAQTMLFDVMRQDLVERFDTAKTLARDTNNLPEILEIWLTCWRDVLLLHTGNDASITYRERQSELLEIVTVTDLDLTVQIITFLENMLAWLPQNANTQLMVENIALALPVLLTETH